MALAGVWPGGGLRLCGVCGDRVDLYYCHNSLGSVTAVVDENGDVQERYSYEAYGKTTVLDASRNPKAQQVPIQPYGFTGRRMDFEEGSGLYFYRYRYYDPEAGRFISRDPLGMWGDAGQRGNAQNYCGNNPVNRVDPLGLDAAQDLAAAEARVGAWLNDATGFEPEYNGMYSQYVALGIAREQAEGGHPTWALRVDEDTGSLESGGSRVAENRMEDVDAAYYEGWTEGVDDGLVSLASDLTFGIAYGAEAARAREHYEKTHPIFGRAWRGASWVTSFSLHILAFEVVTGMAAGGATGSVATAELGVEGATTWAGEAAVDASLTGIPRAVGIFHEAVHSVLSPLLRFEPIGPWLIKLRTPLLYWFEEFSAHFLAMSARGLGGASARGAHAAAYTAATEYAPAATLRQFGYWTASIPFEAAAFAGFHYWTGDTMAEAQQDCADYDEAMNR